MEQIPISVITVTVLFLLFGLFKKLSPIETSPFQTDKSIIELRKKYIKLDFLQIGFLFLLTIALSFIYYNIFIWITDFRISLLDRVVIIVRPFVAAWLVVSMFSAMLTSSMLITYFIKRKLKGDWDEYLAYNDMKYGFNTDKVSRAVIKVFAVITAIIMILCFDWFTAFRQDDVVINDLFGLGNKNYKYEEIVDLRDIQKIKAPNGNIVEEEHYVVVFNDGTKWNSRDNGFSNLNEDTKIIEFLEQKTGKELTELEFDSEN